MALVLVYPVFLCREHDKGPDEFSSVITKLLDAGVEFKLSILGAHTNDIPGEWAQMNFTCTYTLYLVCGLNF